MNVVFLKIPQKKIYFLLLQAEQVLCYQLPYQNFADQRLSKPPIPTPKMEFVVEEGKTLHEECSTLVLVSSAPNQVTFSSPSS